MRKIQTLNFCLVIFSLLLSACTAPQATQPGASPTEAVPTSALLDDWSEVKSRGVLRVGTAADYAPFSYFNSTGQLDGFDIALIRELARRLGVSAQITDFAFDGLLDELLVGQIDAAIAALSITPDRASRVDFTNLYYAGRDGVLARQDASITSVTSVENLAGQRIAVQRGTVYEEWAQNNLVAPGVISPDQLFSYGRPEDAIRDLRDNRVDIVILDLLPAQEAARDGGVSLVGQGLITQQFAIALRQGSTLTAELNRALAEAQTDGTVSKLAEAYLSVEPAVAVATPLPATPEPVSPTFLPPTCVNSMALVTDLSFPDMNMSNPPVLQPGQAFVKGWRVRNTGTCNWDPAFFLSFVRGNVQGAQMNGQPTQINTVVPPGGEVEIWLDLVAPRNPGTYQGFWQMTAPDGTHFGQTIWVGITVPGAEPTPPPDEPFIASFIATPTNIVAGQCTVLFWYVLSGVNQVDLTRNGAWLWVDAPFEGNLTDCPAAAGIYTYVITAQGPGGVRQAQVQVIVAPSGAAR